MAKCEEILLAFMALACCYTATAFEPKPLQDFCVADTNSAGTIEVGFVTSNPENRLISKILNKGDVFVYPVGLLHFQRNLGKTNAVAISGLSSQSPGVVTVANAVFGSNPDIGGAVLAKAFQVDINTISQIQSKF
nr:putative germin-like protein 2-1 [Ipomoea trifida]